MTRHRTRLAAAGTVALAGTIVLAQAPPTPQAPETPRFRAAANVVVVEATVVDRDGDVVKTLGADDFKVEVDGKPREIVSAELVEYAKREADAASGASAATAAPADAEITTNAPTDRGRLVIVIVDQESLTSESRPVLDAAQRWVLALGPQDRVGLITFPNVGPRVDLSTDHARVAEALKKVTGTNPVAPTMQRRNISIWEAVRMEENDAFTRSEVVQRECRGGDPVCPSDVDLQAKTMVLDTRAHVMPILNALRSVVRGLAAIPGPKHAVLLSSGWSMSEREIVSEMSFLAADAAKANVTIHTFTSLQWATSASRFRISPKPAQDQQLLLQNVETIAGMTGGRSIRLTGSYDGAFTQLDGGLTGYYRLGVQALPEDLDGKNHRINLRVTRRGATLQNYRRVLAGTPQAPAVALAPAAELREALKDSEPRTGLDVRATSYVRHGTDGRDLRVTVVGDVGRAAPGRATAVAALYEIDGKPVTARENTIEVPASGRTGMSIEIEAPPGTYALRVAVLDAEGRVGSLERLVEARWVKAGPIETPGLVLLYAGPATANAPRPLFDAVTAADRLIPQVALSGPVANRKIEVTFAITKLGATAPIVEHPGRILETTAGATVAQDSLPVAGLEPGRYTLSATIGGAKPFTRMFTVKDPAAVSP